MRKFYKKTVIQLKDDIDKTCSTKTLNKNT